MAQRHSNEYGTSRSGRSSGRSDWRDEREDRGERGERDEDSPEVRFGRNVSRESRDFGRDDYERGYRGESDWRSGYAGEQSRAADWRSEGRGDFDEGRVSYGYGRRDYRGNVGTGGFGYSESAYGPERSGRRGSMGGGGFGSSESGYGPARYWRGGSEGYSQSRGREYEGQSHRGRGPKGYTRSDERLREIICEKLTDDPAIDASDITVEVRDQVVILDGSVNDRWVKYQVEELVEGCGGVRDVRNQLRVSSPNRAGMGQSGTSQSGTSSAASGSDTRESEQTSGSGRTRSHESSSSKSKR